MTNPWYISVILQDLLFAIILLLVMFYSILILSIRRFRHRHNMFIVNICLSISGTSVFFVIYFTMVYFDVQRLYVSHMCLVLLYAFNIASIAIPFSFVIFSVHRFCFIVYYEKVFFKSKLWVVICIVIHWLLQLILSLPFILRQERVNKLIRLIS